MATNSSSSSSRWKYQFEEISDHVLVDNANDRDDDWSSERCNCYEKLRNKDDECCYDRSCVNFASQTECNPKHCGSNCQNQRFLRRIYAKLDVLEVDGKGFGLFTKEDLQAGQFVREYFGEVVSAKELQRRLDADKEKKHLYIMQLKANTFIDARYKGTIGRFINHSCEPNCNVDIWTSNGKLRVGIFTTQEIPNGGELSFDYHWKPSRFRPLTRCYCGTPSCRGYLEVLTDEEKILYASRKGVWINGLQAIREKNASAEWLIDKRIKIWWEGNKEYFEADVTAVLLEDGKQIHMVFYLIDGKKQKEYLMGGDGTVSGTQWLLLDESKEETAIKKNKRDDDEDDFFEDFDFGFQIFGRGRDEKRKRLSIDMEAINLKEEKVIPFDVARAIVSADLRNDNTSSSEYYLLNNKVHVWKSFIEILRNRYNMRDSVLHSDDLKELETQESQKLVLIGTRDKISSALRDIDDGEKRFQSEKLKRESEVKRYQMMQQSHLVTNDWRLLSTDIIANDRTDFMSTTLDNMVSTRSLPLWSQIPGVKTPVSDPTRKTLLVHLKSLAKRMKLGANISIHSMTLLLRYLRHTEDHGVADSISVIAAVLLLTCKAKGMFKPKMLKKLVKSAYCQIYSRDESEVGDSSCDSYVQRVLDRELVIINLLRHDLFVAEVDLEMGGAIGDGALEVALLLCTHAPTYWVTLQPDVISVCVGIVFTVICSIISTTEEGTGREAEKTGDFDALCQIGLKTAGSEGNLKKCILHLCNGMAFVPCDELLALCSSSTGEGGLSESPVQTSMGSLIGSAIDRLKQWASFMHVNHGDGYKGDTLCCRLPWLSDAKEGALLTLEQDCQITPQGKDLYGGRVLKESLFSSNASQVLGIATDTVDEASVAVSFRSWPLVKEAHREAKKIAAAELDAGSGCGFSASSLHELNIIQHLHYSHPKGHCPNVITPFGLIQLQGTIVLPTLKEEGGGLDDKKPSSSSSSSSSSSIHRFIVFSPVLRSLQQLLPLVIRGGSGGNHGSDKQFPSSLAVEFCRDIMSAVHHCSMHGIFFKWISLDYVYISASSCQLLLGSFSGVGDRDSEKKGSGGREGREGSKEYKRKSSGNDTEKHEKKRQKDHRDHKREKERETEREGDDGDDSFHISTPLYESNANNKTSSQKGYIDKNKASLASLYTSETSSHCLTTTSPEVVLGGSPDAASNTWIACSICVHICTGKPFVKPGRTDEKHVQHLYKVLGTPKALKYKSFDKLPAASVYGRSIIGKNGEPEESRSRIFKHLDTVFPEYILRELSYQSTSSDGSETDGGGIKDMLRSGLHLVPDSRQTIDSLLTMRLFTQRPVQSVSSRRDSLHRFLSL